ncbi:uncharacterized protein LOC117628900 [Prunus dulcis]|uniref:uncharacterized protein LOC117628900 n=1 Tax=Prunus dulcis TaxID=3755 RepID=UPI001482187E|nr:uncharacterized protein LOC117628900 [Prunus dulcis]
MILHKVDDTLMCKVFAMTLRAAAQDWFHTLQSRSISSFKELTYVFTKEYTSYWTIKKNPDHLYNLQIYEIAELYKLWDDDQIAAKKSTNQEDQPIKQAGQRSDGFSNKNKDERRSHPQENTTAGENYTKFTIPIHQILAHGKNKPWVRRPPPLKGDPNKKDASKYCAFHGMHEHTMNNCFARKTHVEELVREGHCTKFVAKQAIQRIEDRDTAKEPPQKVIRINIILADSEECGLTRKKRKRKIKQATVISQISIDLPPVKDDHVISFPKKYLTGLDMPHNDAHVISIQIAQAMVDGIHADEGSAANILQLAVIQ